ncbi:unnamed protein product [Prunus armeniaca]|uniref:Protein CLT2, chloroplastic n=1 Tax=Prunus armeniaca TaxID=36596 RepID=A0A6J5WEP6_PRUAR|nr:unnamed protein product [Prunus armeniaca]
MGYSVSTMSSFSHFFSVPPPLHTYTIKNGATIPFLSLSSMPLPRLYLRRRVPQDAPFHLASETTRRASSTTRNVKAQASLPDPPSSSSNTKRVVLVSALTIALAVANRVLYKLALVPMKNHPFFLAQFTTFGYVIIYFSILFARYRSGIVTDEMIGLPKSRFVAIGALEALGVASGMAAAAMLPGPAIPILSQTFLVWQLSFFCPSFGENIHIQSDLRLHTRSYRCSSGCYKCVEYLVLMEFSMIYAMTGSDSGQMLSGVESMWPVLMIASSAFQAGASIIKEFVFVDAEARLKDKSLDIFVVNSFGSGFQALFIFLFLPFLSNLRGIPFAQLPSYLKDGAGCFLNIGADTSGCNGAPLLPLLYVGTNLFFNISLLSVVKISSAVVASLIVMLSGSFSFTLVYILLTTGPIVVMLST